MRLDMDAAYIFFTIIFSVIGMAYCVYGKKNNPYFLIFGLFLLIFPYFVSSFSLFMLTGIGLILIPFILDRIMPF